MYMFIL